MAIPEDNPKSVMDMISNAGTARDAALTAVDAAEERDFAEAQKWLTRAQNAVNVARQAHNHLLSQEARGEGPDFSVLLVHAETHLTDALAMIDMAKRMVALYQLVYTKLKD
ncbi:PTS lactose/cellobiose transporter subunit IIA [Lacticaseibacillus hulanensis]|uniref:PTS lactose/cellobiose transporter subunit IIA n=1 Tax=Lacticaseibacillus hulanensis TaxID=2493111 RepID=UPI000FDB9053|nr:PTS lactose/cellobiose transporter subunit IIA [Lacticaseibacillus hulanensis]